MMAQVSEFFDLTTLNCVYFTLLVVGVVYAIVILVAGELHDLGFGGGHVDFSGGHDISFDHGEVPVPSLSPVTIASFVTAFGAFGLIATGLFDASARTSLLWAGAGALVVAAIAHFAFGYFLIAPQSSSEVTAQQIIGATGEVTVAIAPGRPGQVAYIARGARVTAIARSADDQPIPRGTLVTIEGIVGNTVIVRPVVSKQ